MLQEVTLEGCGSSRQRLQKKDATGRNDTGGRDSREWLEDTSSGVRNSRMKRRLQVEEEEQGEEKIRSMMTEKRLQEENVEEVTKKRRTTIDENEKFDEVEYQEEASR